MKKLAIISLSIGLALSGNLMAKDKDDKLSKHYGDSQFNGQYYDHGNYNEQDRYNDSRRSRYYDYNTYGSGKIKRARVVDVDPVFRQYARQSQGRQECWNEPRNRRYGSDRKAGSLIGAVLGGVIGYKVGGNHRHNKRSGAAVGAVLGSVIGGEASKNNRRYSQRRCETVYDDRGYGHQEVVGYNVTYKYKGQRYRTFMDYRPGRYIDIRVSTQPVRR